MIHIVVIHAVWSPQLKTEKHQENISFLESFSVQAEGTNQSKDTVAIESYIQDRLIETQNKETKALIPSHPTETSISTHHAAPQPLQPKGINTPQNSIVKKTKPSQTTLTHTSIHHQTDDVQTSTPSLNFHASVLSNPPPPYPRQSRRLGEQGKVVLTAEIATNGKVLQASVNISSGYPRLDRAALESVLKWQLITRKKADVTQKMWVNIPINFILE